MRNIVGLIVGFYLTVALAVFGAAAYSFMSGEYARYSSCPPSWPWAAYRAGLWPKTYFDDLNKVADIPDWLLVRYKPFGDACS
jgi:hypothetical protein